MCNCIRAIIIIAIFGNKKLFLVYKGESTVEILSQNSFEYSQENIIVNKYGI